MVNNRQIFDQFLVFNISKKLTHFQEISHFFRQLLAILKINLHSQRRRRKSFCKYWHKLGIIPVSLNQPVYNCQSYLNYVNLSTKNKGLIIIITIKVSFTTSKYTSLLILFYKITICLMPFLHLFYPPTFFFKKSEHAGLFVLCKITNTYSILNMISQEKLLFLRVTV